MNPITNSFTNKTNKTKAPLKFLIASAFPIAETQAEEFVVHTDKITEGGLFKDGEALVYDDDYL